MGRHSRGWLSGLVAAVKRYYGFPTGQVVPQRLFPDPISWPNVKAADGLRRREAHEAWMRRRAAETPWFAQLAREMGLGIALGVAA